MTGVGSPSKQRQQGRIVDRDYFPRRRLDIDGKIGQFGIKWCYSRRDALGLAQIRWPCSSLRVAETRAKEHHAFLFAAREKRKTLGPGRASEAKQAIAVNAGKAEECLLQLFTRHALDRVAPEAVD